MISLPTSGLFMQIKHQKRRRRTNFTRLHTDDGDLALQLSAIFHAICYTMRSIFIRFSHDFKTDVMQNWSLSLLRFDSEMSTQLFQDMYSTYRDEIEIAECKATDIFARLKRKQI